jgi:hypothetical protein
MSYLPLFLSSFLRSLVSIAETQARNMETKEQALTYRQTKANEFEGTGGPEDKIDEAVRDRPGDDDVTANVR